MAAPKPPAGAGKAGRRLWAAVVDEFDLAEHELTLLRQAVHAADLCETLRELVDSQGPILAGRANPAIVELRLQRQQLSRLVVALRVPLGEESDDGVRGQYRGMRGVYSLHSVDGEAS